MCELVTSKTQL